MTVDGEQVENLARELYRTAGHVIIGHLGHSGERRLWKLDRPLKELWDVTVPSLWRVIGFATKEDYEDQIVMIKKLRPTWPRNYASPRGASYYLVAPEDAA